MAKRKEEVPPELWEQQPGESPKAFYQFSVYRDMGPTRSHAKVAEKVGKSRAAINSMSRKHQWVARCEAYDRETDRKGRLELENGIIEMRQRHVQLAKVLLQKGLTALKNIPEDKLPPGVAVSMIKEAAALERLSRGEATERTEGTTVVTGEVSVGAYDLRSVNDETLMQLEALIGQVNDAQSKTG